MNLLEICRIMLAFSLVRTGSGVTVKTVCIKELASLPCLSQNPSTKDVVWKYKGFQGTNWSTIWDTSQNKASLSGDAPLKFKNVDLSISDGDLKLSPFSSKLSGIYSCRDIKGQSRPYLQAAIAVNCEKTACEGDTVMIECELLKYGGLIGLNSYAELEWKKENEKLVSSDHYMKTSYINPKYQGIGLTRGALTIESVSKDWNDQRLTCVVHQGNGSTPKRYSVIIKVQKCQKMLSVCQGKSIDLKCPYYQWMINRTEDITVVWYRNSTKIATSPQGRAMMSSESPLVKVSGDVLTLVSPGTVDSGKYRCEVFSRALLVAKHDVTLNVTKCHSPGHRNLTNSGDEGKKQPPKPGPKSGADEDADGVEIFIVVLFCVFVVDGLLMV